LVLFLTFFPRTEGSHSLCRVNSLAVYRYFRPSWSCPTRNADSPSQGPSFPPGNFSGQPKSIRLDSRALRESPFKLVLLRVDTPIFPPFRFLCFRFILQEGFSSERFLSIILLLKRRLNSEPCHIFFYFCSWDRLAISNRFLAAGRGALFLGSLLP